MKRLIWGVMALACFLFGGVYAYAATEVTDFRWVTRYDSHIPFVRMVLDVDKLPSVDAKLNRDGTVLTVELKKAQEIKYKVCIRHWIRRLLTECELNRKNAI